MTPPAIRRALALVTAAALGACETQPTHEVLSVVDIAPRQLEVGDRVVIRGSGFPQPGDIRRITVSITGVLARPGLAACPRPVSVTLSDPPEGERTYDPATGTERDAVYASSTMHQLRVHGGADIEFTLTEELLRALTTCSGERPPARAPHATLGLVGPRAGVSVRVDTMQGTTLASAQSLRGPRLDVLTPWGREVAEGREARTEADRALTALGIRLAEVQPTEGGLQIERVTPGSPADEAGLGDGDVMERLDGVTLLGVTDFRPAAGGDLAVVSVRRGDAVEDRGLRVAAITRAASNDVVATAVLLLVALAVVAFGMSPRRGLLGWLGQRLLPARREAWTLRGWREALAGDAGFVSAAVASTALTVPFAEFLFDANPDLGAAHIVGVLASLTVAALSARAELNHPTLLATLRGAVRRLAFEAPAVGAVVAAVFLSGSIDAQGVAAAQGGSPWDWYLFRGPLLCALGVGHLAALVPLAVDVRAATHRALRGAAWATLLARAAYATALLCGGTRLPGLTLGEQGASVALQMLGAVAFMAKGWGLVALARYLAPGAAAAHPALRTALALRHLGPLAVIAAVLTLVGDVFTREAPAGPRELAATIASLATFGAVAAAALRVLRRPVVWQRA
jgi:NADH-quinone oxidoreductase subunit H